MIFLLRFLGIVAVLVAITLTLQQIIRYPIVGWQWEQMLQFGYHESTALFLAVLAAVSFVCAQIKKKKMKDGKGKNDGFLSKEEVTRRCQRIKEICQKEY